MKEGYVVCNLILLWSENLSETVFYMYVRPTLTDTTYIIMHPHAQITSLHTLQTSSFRFSLYSPLLFLSRLFLEKKTLSAHCTYLILQLFSALSSVIFIFTFLLISTPFQIQLFAFILLMHCSSNLTALFTTYPPYTPPSP